MGHISLSLNLKLNDYHMTRFESIRIYLHCPFSFHYTIFVTVTKIFIGFYFLFFYDLFLHLPLF